MPQAGGGTIGGATGGRGSGRAAAASAADFLTLPRLGRSPQSSKVRFFSPEGATVDSQGCKPLVGIRLIILALEGRWTPPCGRHATFEKPIALPGLIFLLPYRPGVRTPGYLPTSLQD